jgi:endonuclease-3
MPHTQPAAATSPAAASRRTAKQIVDALCQQHPNAFTELAFTTPFELLVATVLSAQSTDARVNSVTPVLFAAYPTAAALSGAPVSDVERLVKATGFFRMKARAIIGLSAAIVERHQGEVPTSMAELVALPGVGRKTANVVLGHAFGVPAFPVDRHVMRVATRLGLATGKTPEAIEVQLCAAIAPELWTVASDSLILHGRRVCRPTPQCPKCAARTLCAFARTPASQPPARPRKATKT